MGASKTRISVTIIHQLAQILEEMAKEQNVSKSALVESCIKKMADEKLAKDAKKLAKMKFDDLPNEDEWLAIMPDF